MVIFIIFSVQGQERTSPTKNRRQRRRVRDETKRNETVWIATIRNYEGIVERLIIRPTMRKTTTTIVKKQ